MAVVETIKCETCGVEVKGKLALYQHNKKVHGIEKGPEVSPKVVEVKKEEKVEVKEVKDYAKSIKEEGIELLTSYCRVNLRDVEYRRTFDKICEQQFIETYIPFGIGEKEGAQYEAGTNGLLFVIPKGQRVILPKSFVDEIFAQQNIKGFDDFKITSENPMGKLTSVRV